MNTEILTIPCLQDNYAFIIHNHKLNETFLIDAPESYPIIDILEKKNWGLEKIILTHHHSDHVMGINDLIKKYDPSIIGADADKHRLPILGERINANTILTLGNLKFEIIDVPGHTIGHLAFYCKEISALFSGDSLMAFGCGRLFEGTPAMMWNSLNKLKKLPPDTKVYSGHEYAIKNLEFALSIDRDNEVLQNKYITVKNLVGKSLPSVPSTIKDELETNPFLRANNFELKKILNMENESDEDVFAELRKKRDIF